MTVSVTEEENTPGLARCSLVGLNPLANACRSPHALYEADGASFNVGAVVTTHDWFDGFSGFIGMVEWDSRDVVVEDVRFDDAVEQLSSDKSELSVDGRSGTTDIVPTSTSVVRKRRVSVLKIGDSDYNVIFVSKI